jgi:hypothetical protein
MRTYDCSFQEELRSRPSHPPPTYVMAGTILFSTSETYRQIAPQIGCFVMAITALEIELIGASSFDNLSGAGEQRRR